MAGGTARDIKNKIQATKKTSQITKAMHMVSAAKLRRAERTMREYHPFMKSIKNTISQILNSNLDISHKMLQKREVKKTGYLLITSDRGLAGGYNNNLFRQFLSDMKEKHGSPSDYVLGILGNRGYSYFKNKDVHIINNNAVNLRDDVQFIDIIDLIQKLIDMYVLEEIDEIIVYYNQYVNTIRQDIVSEKILPVDNIDGDNEESTILYEFEPSAQQVLNTLMPIYIQNIIYGFILNAKASEHAARMTAMKNATDNAKDIVDNLTLHYNRARQASITQELTEIVGGAAALK
ncbi:ATP synthase F1 subunit gamma [Mycoplasmatota bacterium]|nr:ATP synthase F1 subunit gamma [Mycoplasmatota bacterium]